MIKKITITKVFKNENNKDGVPYVYKNGQYAGQPFTRIGIQTEQTGEETYYTNAKAKDKAMTLDVGQSVLLNLTEENAEDGKIWRNFSFPTKEQLAEFAASVA